jgi:6-phosphogluconolactonase (cycloisomerase 2 family)
MPRRADDSIRLTAHKSLKAAAGSGPRHAAFWQHGDTTYFYLVAELAVSLTVYKVTYLPKGGLAFEQVYEVNTFGGKKFPAGAAPAEVEISVSFKFSGPSRPPEFDLGATGHEIATKHT